MDKPLSAQTQVRARAGRWLRVSGAIAGLVLLAWLVQRWLRPAAGISDFRLATVERGMVENSITTTGLVVPAYEQLLTAPVTARLISVMHQAGSDVQQDELILELDEAFVRLEYEQLRDELELRKNNVTGLNLTYDKDLRDLDIRDQIKALQVSSLEAQLRDARQLQAAGGTAQEEVRKAELALDIARLEKSQLENELRYRKAALDSDRRKLDLEVQIQEKRLAELEQKLRQTAVRAPQAGVITWVLEDIGKNVTAGEALVRLANLSSFRIEGTGSDMYADRIQVGLPVKVRINQTYLPGNIVSIAPAVKENTLSFQVVLEDPAAAVLRPNMQVEVFVITDQKSDALRVVNGPAFTGAREQEIFVVEGNVARRRRVRIGLNNLAHVELIGDVQPGEQVIISDMRDYLHLSEIQLKP